MNRDTPAGKASVKHLCEVFGVSRQAYLPLSYDDHPEQAA